MKSHSCAGALVCAFFLAQSSSLFGQGSLTPPGSPAPTMKSLDQVEPRIDLNKLTGTSGAVVVITAPGSYYLSRNLQGSAGKDTITSAVSGHITIDLNGFALTDTGSGRAAISTSDAVTVRNGTIHANASPTTVAVVAANGHGRCEDLQIFAGAGAALQLGDDGTVRRCHIVHGGIKLLSRGLVEDTRVNSGFDDVSIELGDEGQVLGSRLKTTRGYIAVGERAIISDCAVDSGGPPTLFVNGVVLQSGGSSVVRNCSVKAGSTVGNGIAVGSNSVVSHCRVASVFRDGITAPGSDVTVESCGIEGFGRHGISLGPNARVRDCTVNAAGLDGITVGDHSIVSGSTATGTTSVGIIAGNGCTIRDCNVSLNNGNGITAGIGATIQNCNARSNQGNGILAGGSSIVIDCLTNGNGKKTAPTNANSDGIEIGGRSRVINCNSFNNGGAGILSNSTNNREFIEGCLLHSNDGFAISLQANGNTVIKNQVGGNTGGTINQSGGNIAPIQSASTAVGSIHPLANFQ